MNQEVMKERGFLEIFVSVLFSENLGQLTAESGFLVNSC
jgi:hypothetical protein